MNDDANRQLWSGLGGAFLSLVRVTLRELVLDTRNLNNCLITMTFVCLYCQYEIITTKDRAYVLS